MPGSRFLGPLAALASIVGGAVLALDVTAAWASRVGVARVVPPLALATAILSLVVGSLASSAQRSRTLVPGIAAAALFAASFAFRPDGALLAGWRLAGAVALDVAGNALAGVLAVRVAGAVEDDVAGWAAGR